MRTKSGLSKIKRSVVKKCIIEPIKKSFKSLLSWEKVTVDEDTFIDQWYSPMIKRFHDDLVVLSTVQNNSETAQTKEQPIEMEEIKGKKGDNHFG
jgi:hypothetical protein